MTMKPFQSKLNPHFELIRSLRRKRKTWCEIATELEALGMKAAPSSIYEYFKRHSRRPAPLGWEDPKEEKAAPSPNAQLPKWMKPEERPDDLDLSFDDPSNKFFKK
jgi:hypothetical protein